MEAISPYSLGKKMRRDCVVISYRVMPAMKRRIKAGNLRESWLAFQQCPDRCKVVGLVKRRKRYISLKVLQDMLIDTHRARVVRPAMNDPMTNRDKLPLELLP
jgi:hypothetical protein